MFRQATVATLAMLWVGAAPLAAQTPGNSRGQVLFATPDKYNVPYRIPALATTRKGTIIAVADRRYCGADIGYGRIDIVARTSRDNGRTWSADTVIQRGSGVEGAYDCGYGDAAIVADRTSNRVLCMSVTGNVAYIQGTRERPNRIARWYSPDGGRSWTPADDVTDAFYAMLPHTRTMFIGSGRLMQSRLVRKGRYYRVYCSVLTRTAMPDGSDVAANFVIYTDDFGATWHVLGGTTLDAADSPCVGGDEPKVEELPNGDVVLSSRKHYGRYFNIFHFDDFGHDQTNGWWDACVASHDIAEGISVGGNSCNGEIFLVDATEAATGRAVKLMLQSLPFDDARAHVGIWYKEIKRNGWYSTAAFAHQWTRGLIVSQTGSAYSTMAMQKDGRIGFFYEEEPNYYNMVYVALTIEEITGGRYR
ncbi:MAG: exo-alpha-sialidase [Bacteroidaceae bacterium]|nr:exo-alpha-sialidase [Bacteroidaceae bacterium]